MTHHTIQLDWSVPWLADKAANVTSQFGEDGLIAGALQHFAIPVGNCFEVGAGDGLFYSNTKALRDVGWRCTLIEADEAQWRKCCALESPAVRVLHCRLTPDNLPDVLNEQYQFGVLDVDGQETHLLRALTMRCPRTPPDLLLVEHAYRKLDVPEPPLDGSGQAGLQILLAIASEYGYTPLAQTPCNVLFARSRLCSRG